MPKQQIDPDKLRMQLRGLRKDALLDLLHRAVELLPKTRLPALVEGHIDPHLLAPDGEAAGRLLDVVRTFREASLRGDYYEGFAVDSRNFMEMSHGTESWIAECERLFEGCVAGAKKGRAAEMREAFETLLDLLRHIDEGHDDIIFFADEGGSWQVGVDWRKVLPAYFACLSPATAPEEYAAAVDAVIRDFVGHDRDGSRRAARAAASAAQKKALRHAGKSRR